MSVFLDSFKSLIADEFFKHHNDGLLSSRIVSLNICKKFMSAKVVKLILDGGWSSWTTSSGAKCNNVGERGLRFAPFGWQEYMILISIQSRRNILSHISVFTDFFLEKVVSMKNY
jgi:hypothetical protein